MYFAKNEFIPNAEVAERAKRDARQAIDAGRQYFDITLDGTHDSLHNLDAILDRIHRSVSTDGLSREATQRFVQIFGSYFGEVLSRTFGATWGELRIYSDRVDALQVGSRGVIVNPWRWVSEQMVEGTGNTLRTHFETIARSIQTGEASTADRVEPTPQSKTSASPGKLYTLRHDQGYFDTGTSADGRQILMSFFWTGLTAIFFDGEGNLLECEVRPLPAEPTFHPTSGMALNTVDFDAAVERSMEAWKREIDFRPMPIRVYQFSLPEHGVGIEDRPGHYEEFLKAPDLEEPDEEERQEMFERIREWDEEGSFVLYWGNDLWLAADGAVTSS